MTRLKTADVMNIPAMIQNYDYELKKVTGLSLMELALEVTNGLKYDTQIHRTRVAVIPVTSGEGAINGFSEAVQSIAFHLGFDAFVTKFPDVRGLAEAYNKKADLIMIADDHNFIAINLGNGRVVNNTEATAAGYVAALKQMCGSLVDQTVLLLGAGFLGSCAAERLLQHGARLIIHDLDQEIERSLASKLITNYGGTKVLYGYGITRALSMSRLIFDASSGDVFIHGGLLQDNSFVAAPGIPIGLNEDAILKVGTRVVHDPLQIGVAVMLFQALGS